MLAPSKQARGRQRADAAQRGKPRLPRAQAAHHASAVQLGDTPSPQPRCARAAPVATTRLRGLRCAPSVLRAPTRQGPGARAALAVGRASSPPPLARSRRIPAPCARRAPIRPLPALRTATLARRGDPHRAKETRTKARARIVRPGSTKQIWGRRRASSVRLAHRRPRALSIAPQTPCRARHPPGNSTRQRFWRR